MYDAHIHLDQYEYISRNIEHWKRAGVTGVVAVSTDLRSSYKTLALKEKFPDFIFAAVGFHPEQPLPNESDVQEWKHLVQRERHLISAIGEVGLPYYTISQYENITINQYIHFLDRMVAIAAHEQLPIVLHAVHSHAPIAYELLVKHKIKKAHFHWLKAEEVDVMRIIQSGYYISVTPEICYRNRDMILARRVPLQQLLVETDGPWSFSGPFDGRPTSPLFLQDVAKKISVVKGLPLQTVIAQLTKNTLALYQ
ncbi:TatD family hydrolase [Ectobacillus polymachus]|uniref:TatD family hydrolase n=1 Tax=Ectobacillus polymachus TaxID=1508806 RepID=UPI003A83A3C1